MWNSKANHRSKIGFQKRDYSTLIYKGRAQSSQNELSTAVSEEEACAELYLIEFRRNVMHFKLDGLCSPTFAKWQGWSKFCPAGHVIVNCFFHHIIFGHTGLKADFCCWLVEHNRSFPRKRQNLVGWFLTLFI